MAVYFDYKVEPFYKDGKCELIAWHKTYPILAVAWLNEDKTCVCFYLDEGDLVDGSKIEKPSKIANFAWHPSKKILASGWHNGSICLWNEQDKELHEAPSFHSAEITSVCWNATGSRIISADRNGLVCVWKIDQRGRTQQSPMFKNELQSIVVQMVAKNDVNTEVIANITAAAHAAVSGDQQALDMLNWPKSKKFNLASVDGINLYIATKDGNVYFLDDRGKCSQCFQVDGSIANMLYYDYKDIILTLTDTLLLSQHAVKQAGEYNELSKVKLSGKPANFSITWAGPGLVATACQERVVRILDIDNDQNFILSLDTKSGFNADECINAISHSRAKGVLAGGTNQGHVAMWKYETTHNDTWLLQSSSDVAGNTLQIEWGGNSGLLATKSEKSVTILNQSVMNFHFNDNVAVVQVSPNHLLIETFPSRHVADLKTDVHIKGLFCNKNHTTIWNGKKVVVYEVAENKSLIRSVGTFNSDVCTLAVREQNIYMVDAQKITVRTFQGTVKQELVFSEKDGDPIQLDICGNFMVVATNQSILKIYDLSRREARQISVTKHVKESVPNIGLIVSIKCNMSGTKVAFITQNNNQMFSSFLYVWEVESDKIQYFNFATSESSFELEESLLATQNQIASQTKGCVPQKVYWDTVDTKLLACEVVRSGEIKNNKEEIQTQSMVVTMFSCPENGLVVQDHFVADSCAGLLAIDTPYVYLVKSTSDDVTDKEEEHVICRTLRDFIGLEEADAKVRSAMTTFSYQSAIGNMDEAFKAIKAIKSLDFSELELDVLLFEEFMFTRQEIEYCGSVWENMAKMCVKTKRLDVALVCLGNVGNAAGAQAVREAMSTEPELDAQVGMLALQLGMYQEAERLYKECARYDLLNIYYQASNNWEKAIECAEKHDRIHLRSTFYCYAQYLEEKGEFEKATQNYERSGTYRFEVPRMLADDADRLEEYVNKGKDSSLKKWWAGYLESEGDLESALDYYKLAEDYLSLVRIHCFCGNMKEAEDICSESGCQAACYHLARQYEASGDIKQAIHFFSRAQSYTNAIRLAKENEYDHDLVNMCLLSTQEDMLDCARYFEEKGGLDDKAVMLYHRGGNASQAIDLAFRTKQFNALETISEDLDETADPEVLRLCAEFFIEHEKYERAIGLLVASKKYDEAIRMCFDRHINITEEIAESMPAEKHILEKIAECAFKQGSYHLATKKFTQAGNKLKAMKSLLKSGDTEKIVFFAGVSRQREIYVMAANYLQSLDWRKEPEIMKNIISFYTKGRALESLSAFYDSCAQVEIDEFENYEKAFGALTESYKCLSKAKVKNPSEQEERLASMKSRLSLMKKYIHARKEYASGADQSVNTCELLLEDPDVDEAVRIPHIYAFLIEHYTRVQEFNRAHELITTFQQQCPSLRLEHFVVMETLEKVESELGVKIQSVASNDPASDEEDEIEEEEEEEEEYI